ncbi:MAG: DNA gyrase subunit A [Leptolinea sp.]|nr:DNA gyrase subunit A [Leptolinea sp.]
MTPNIPENPVPSEQPVEINPIVDIDHEMRKAYLDYAMSVIVARALPDARDGLKPVHRRILFGMLGLSNHHNSPFKKSARIVGEVLGKYHPHGDSSVYEAMARMAQDFSMRYPLVDGQGNFGSVDGDAPAAMRYTEARLGLMAEEMLLDIEKNTVDFADNFDATLKEPIVLPSRLPNLLLNGSSGIAVGMATNIPPHNLRELVKAITYMIQHYENIDNITPDKLMEMLPGPDFPTGGVIVGTEGIRQAYSTGRGRIVLRGLAHIEEIRGGRFAIVVTEIPYQVNKSSLIERIAELVREGRIDNITDLRDESDRRGMSIVIELKRNAEPLKVLNQLFKFTPLQSTFGVQLLALVDGEPRTLSLKRSLQIFVDHRKEVITRRSQYELDKARARMHILEGLLIALANLDEVIATIRRSPDADVAKTRLMNKFKLTEIQTQAILDMQLRRLAALEREKIEKEAKEVKALITYLEDLLANPRKILKVIEDDLKQIGDKFGDERRTRIAHDASEKLDEEDLQADVPVLISITQRGYVKRTQTSQYKTQGRGGRGVSGQGMKSEDEIAMLIPARSLNTILFFSDQDKVYSEKAYQFPDANRTDKGMPIQNILSIGSDEKITTAVAVQDFESASFFTMATVKGKIKRVVLSEFASVRTNGLIAMSLEKGDQLGWVRQTSGNDEIIMVTRMGKALRMKETAVRAMGRQAAGVVGIKLAAGDKVTSMEVIEPDSFLLTMTEQGYGKRTAIKNYPAKGRATGGVMTMDEKALAKTGLIVSARIVKDTDEVTIMTSGGVMLRLKVKDIASQGRASRGVHIINLTKNQLAVSMARLSQIDSVTGQPSNT